MTPCRIGGSKIIRRCKEFMTVMKATKKEFGISAYRALIERLKSVGKGLW